VIRTAPTIRMIRRTTVLNAETQSYDKSTFCSDTHVLDRPYTSVRQVTAVFALRTLLDTWYSQHRLGTPYFETATYLQNKRKHSVIHTPYLLSLLLGTGTSDGHRVIGFVSHTNTIKYYNSFGRLVAITVCGTRTSYLVR
jgi:hypothetical protein